MKISTYESNFRANEYWHAYICLSQSILRPQKSCAPRALTRIWEKTGKTEKFWLKVAAAPFWPTLAVLLQENLILTYSMEKDYKGPLLCSLENFITLDALFRGRRPTFSAIVSSSQNFSTYVLSRRALSVHIRKFMLVCFTAMCRIQMLASFCSQGKLLVLSQKAHIATYRKLSQNLVKKSSFFMMPHVLILATSANFWLSVSDK